MQGDGVGAFNQVKTNAGLNSSAQTWGLQPRRYISTIEYGATEISFGRKIHSTRWFVEDSGSQLGGTKRKDT
jgi:hypothetical protein